MTAQITFSDGCSLHPLHQMDAETCTRQSLHLWLVQNPTAARGQPWSVGLIVNGTVFPLESPRGRFVDIRGGFDLTRSATAQLLDWIEAAIAHETARQAAISQFFTAAHRIVIDSVYPTPDLRSV